MFTVPIMRHRIWFIALFQTTLVLGALVLAWLLRFDFSLPYRNLLVGAAPILILIRLGVLRLFNLHRGWWHFSGVNEAVTILKAVSAGTVVFWLLMTVLRVTSFPRSIYILEAVLTAGFFAGGRLLSRVLAESIRTGAPASRRVILIGAGFAAQMVIREIERAGSDYEILGCIDDDPSKLGIRIQGTAVIGSVDELPSLLSRFPADEILIAIPSATGEQMQRFIAICQEAQLPFRTVPALRDILNGTTTIGQIREVRIEDLLGREPVEMDLEFVRRELKGRVVLVTGAAGSIGSELCRQIQTYEPSRVICVDQSETGIFYLQQELTKGRVDNSIVFSVADVGDAQRIRAIFKEHRPQVVFHAAAYKHVPVMEQNSHEAVKNNVFVLMGLLNIAEKNFCESFVLISSDKAVNPTNIMGATKRIGELIVACRQATSMRCVSVRFGNVLGSNGSVVPIFQQQLRNNQPLTVTHREVRRFFMTTREAVSLVLQAFVIGERGDILVLDMGEPVPILHLARTLIHLCGKTEDQVGIRFTGLREGEKLCEELFSPNEQISATSRQKIRRVRSKPMAWPVLLRHLEELQVSMMADSAAPIRAKLREIVPEYLTEENGQFTVRQDSKPAPQASRQVAGGA
jgi:FlaA1/EpsC-like NDP-sugar epimerase